MATTTVTIAAIDSFSANFLYFNKQNKKDKAVLKTHNSFINP